MRIHSESVIAHPVSAVFEAYRDRLSEVAAYLDDIREIVVESRDEQPDGIVALHNVWSSDKSIPAVARKFIRPEDLQWDDYARWHAADTRCEWRIETRVFTDALSCSGQTRLVVQGEGTRVVLEGELSLDIAKVRGVPRLIARTVGPTLEKFVVGLIKPNLERTNQAIGSFLDDHSD